MAESQKSIKWIIPIKKLVITSKTGDWCKLPYHNHPKGCPNYGKRNDCPPKAPKFTNIIDINRRMFIVHSEFDLETHVEEMFRLHPKWTINQAKCVLYWQSRSRKQLKQRVSDAKRFISRQLLDFSCPEAMGVNVFATAKLSGLKLDKTKNIKTCRHISILGYPK